MSTPNIVILDAQTFHFPDKTPWAPIEKLGHVTIHDRTESAPAVITERCRDAQIVLTNKVPFDRETLAGLPGLKLISMLATGYNVIDIEAATEHGITVCNAPSYGTSCVAQHTVALMLELCNRVGEHAESVRRGDWVRSPDIVYWLQAPRELAGLTIGLIGLGEIGRGVAERLRPFGCEFIAYTPSRRNGPDWPEFSWASSVEEVFERADIVSLHCPQTADNAGFVNATRLSRMKRGSFIVNTARGTLINEHDLAAALRNGPLAGAALDVVAHEPMLPDNPLRTLDNAFITPHLAWASEPSRLRLIEINAANIAAFLSGKPQNVVNG
ncbi:D-2-hydroxyacid dehydrogenase [Ruficoccus amylovorans]|uniref:D-2-hydroxyacid dehydrogenase n=1 Tax=Ruficoccus amylovorans TaxID=1804625 RepID=A0A842HID3_9BACT|nr:D-2-hydroxyacid dehydrogenase [Ruficoccus amylovorans]MBC2596172.1 D-2-hydroxyacid dehydrogenase [Ruficoccus amylovorans]